MSHAHEMHPEDPNAIPPLDDPEPGSTWFFSIVSIIVFIAFVLGTCVLFFKTEQTYVDANVVNVPVVELERLRLEQRAKLAEYGNYTEEFPGAENEKPVTVTRLRIPINRAMEVVAAELSGASVSGEPK